MGESNLPKHKHTHKGLAAARFDCELAETSRVERKQLAFEPLHQKKIPKCATGSTLNPWVHLILRNRGGNRFALTQSGVAIDVICAWPGFCFEQSDTGGAHLTTETHAKGKRRVGKRIARKMRTV